MEKSLIETMYYESPCGRMMLGATDGRLCLCDWRNGKDRSQVDNRLKRLLKADFAAQEAHQTNRRDHHITQGTAREGGSNILALAAQQLDEYFAGKRREFTVPLLVAGTDFQKVVWTELQKIPFGQTITYAQLAAKIGHPQSVRAVANAVGANAISIFIPCHRVIGNNNSLTGYAGGLAAKRHLLLTEGLSEWSR